MPKIVMTSYEVMYVPADPATINKDTVWFLTKCDDITQAEALEKSFHTAGWAARIRCNTTTQTYLA